MPVIRKGQAPGMLGRAQFHDVFMRNFHDPAYGRLARELAAIEDVAWDAYSQGRKAPVTRTAGPEFADPDYELSVEWKETRDRLLAAQKTHDDPAKCPRPGAWR